ncbi:MAG TPA: hypothetical protein VNN25_06785 [Thermoanaerobaculia bacterium]|nr:hypothetical protein [Thermoanaerobaculia bacterium]
MAIRDQRRVLLFLWFGGFASLLVYIYALYLADWIGPESFAGALSTLSAAFGPYLGAMLTFFWTAAAPAKKAGPDPKTAWAAALCGSALWIASVAALLLQPLLGHVSMEETLPRIVSTTAFLSWIVAGAIGYYFAASQK